jgi:hypothetical protein
MHAFATLTIVSIIYGIAILGGVAHIAYAAGRNRGIRERMAWEKEVLRRHHTASDSTGPDVPLKRELSRR